MKNLKELSIEELLDLAKNSVEKDTNEKKVNEHVLEFVREYSILSGTDLIPNYLIYYNYRRIWRSESRKKLSKIEFFRNFNRLFEQRRTTNVRYYLLDAKSFDMSPESLDQAQLSDKIYENKRKNKKLAK